MSHPDPSEIRRAIRAAGADLSIQAPPGRVAVSRERVLAGLGVPPEDSAEIDEALEEIGGDLMALERPRSMSLSLGPHATLKPPPPPVLFFLVSESMFD